MVVLGSYIHERRVRVLRISSKSCSIITMVVHRDRPDVHAVWYKYSIAIFKQFINLNQAQRCTLAGCLHFNLNRLKIDPTLIQKWFTTSVMSAF